MTADDRLPTLIAESRELIFVVGPDGVLAWMSPSVGERLGWDPEETTGAGISDQVHPNDRSRFADELQRVFGEGPGSELKLSPHRVRHRDGSWRHLDTIATNHTDQPGIGGVVLYGQDVTELVSVRKRLRFKEELLAAVGQAVIATDLAGEVIYWNPAAERMYGWSRDQALGRNIMELTAPEASQEKAEQIMDVLRSGDPWTGEFEVQRRDGTSFTAYVTNSPVMAEDGTLQGIIGVSSDISERKATEAALTERVKELHTLHQASRILNDASRSTGERLQEVVELIPPGWLHPAVTEARLRFDDREYSTSGFRETEWMLAAPVRTPDRKPGRLEVVLTESRPVLDEGPFLREERELLDDLALLIADSLEREYLARTMTRTFEALEEAVVTTTGLTIDYANPAAERIFRAAPGELVGTDATTLLVGGEEAAKEAVTILEREGVFHGADRLRRVDGTTFQSEHSVSLMEPDQGVDGGTVAVVRDVTEQVEAEAELRASEERFRQITERINDVFWIASPDWSTLEYVSPAFAEIWGRPVAEVREDPGVWLEAVIPRDRPRVLDSLHERSGNSAELEYRIRRPDGEIRWILDRAFPVIEDGAVVRLVGVAEDITERKQAQEQLALLSQEMGEGIQVIAPDGTIRFATAASEGILGYPPETVEGRSAFEFVHADDRSELEEMIRELIGEPGAVARSRFRGLTRKGEVRYLESVARNRIDHPAIGGLIVTTRDMTEQRRLEEQLRQSQRMEAVGRLAGGIAHDFNNLLTVIRSETDLLETELEEGAGDDAVIRQAIESIGATAGRAASLTKQLLAFSREQVLQPRVIDLSAVVDDTGRLLRRVIGEDVALEMELEADLPPVRLDPGQLEHVIVNLAVNARDAMPGGGTLSLRTYLMEEADEVGMLPPSRKSGHHVVLEASDDGVGMDAQTLSSLFDPFYTTKEAGQGTGLGLAMAYGFVTQSGGTIRVESEPGRGATFRLCFPATDEELTPEPTQRASRVTGDLDHARVLLVEDNEAVRRVTARVLERAGVEVVAFGSAEEGMDALEQGSFDLVLTDLVLPGRSGRDLLEHVTNRDPDVPVIMMSGYDETAPGARAELIDSVRFVEKPFTPHQLVQAVRDELAQG
jgi:PAS domain S-box-containing protein